MVVPRVFSTEGVSPFDQVDWELRTAEIKDELRTRVKALAERGVVPGLGTVLVGNDPGSQAYVNGKHRDCAEVGINSLRVDLPADASQEQVEAAAEMLKSEEDAPR